MFLISKKAPLMLLTFVYIVPIPLFVSAVDFSHNLNEKQQSNKNYTTILNFWKDHKSEFNLNSQHEEVVLLMGNSGAGKTTISLGLVGRNLNAVKKNAVKYFVDDEYLIGTNSSSRTLIPQAMIDPVNKITYIDCSGFRDNRDIEYEISSIYFQKILMNQVKKIKLLFVINYDSLKSNGNKNDFDDLFNHIGEFIQNITKFHEGIALVVTKVENTYEESDDGSMQLVNDNQSVLDGIASYLREKRDVYTSRIHTNEKYKMFIDLIDVLLQTNDNLYSRIAVLRDPARLGPLSVLPKTRQQIERIRQIVITQLSYVKIEKDDFGFALSDALKYTVNQVAGDIFRSALMNSLLKMNSETLTHYSQKEKYCSDILILRKEMTTAFDVMSGINMNAPEPLELFKSYLNATNNLNISVSLGNLKTISEDIEKLNFFTTVADENGNSHMMLLRNGLQSVLGSIKNLRLFYEFLIDLHNHLNSYNEQTLKRDTRIQNIIASCSGSRHMMLKDIHSLENIAHEFKSTGIYETIRTLELNEYQLKHLKMVFEAFSQKIDISFVRESNTMTVKGFNIQLSDVTKDSSWQDAKVIRLFALNKMFIDCSIDKTGAKVKLFIFAPTWEVVGEQRIILNGKPGRPHKEVQATSSTLSSEKGRNGKQGLPGGSAGHFYGVGGEFFNAEALTIEANGGKGGPGQHGGNGANGIAGEGLPNSFFSQSRNLEDLEPYLKAHNYVYYTSPLEFKSFEGSVETHSRLDVLGKPATKPTDGGNGGAGGTGGYPGIILINGGVKLVRTSNQSGSKGDIGQGGKGGKETTEGRRVKFGYFVTSGYFTISNLKYLDINWINGTQIPAGKNGVTETNTNDHQQPEIIPMVSFPAIISFKDFVINNLFENIKESKLTTFMIEIENNENIKSQYNTLAFVQELEVLEHRFLELKNRIDFVPFYNSLLLRIEKFAISKLNLEHKKVLNYVYTAALTKVFTLKNKIKSETVVNLTEYLKTVKLTMENLRENQHLQIIEKYRNDYKKNLQVKIDEANFLIETKIEPEIDKLLTKSDSQLNAIVDEIRTNRNSTKNEIMSLETKKDKIHEMMPIRSALLVLKLGGSFLTLAGPIGAGVGVALTGVASISEGMFLDTTSSQGQNKIPSLDPNLKLMSRVTEVLNNKPNIMLEKLTLAITKFDDYKENLETSEEKKQEISQKIRNQKKELNKIKNSRVRSIKEVQDNTNKLVVIENEFEKLIKSQTEIQEKEKKLLTDQRNDKKNIDILTKEIQIEKSIRRLNDIQSIVNSGEIVFSFIKKVKNDEGMIENINKQISKYIDELNLLEKMENQVYDMIIPDFRQMENMIASTKTSLNQSSHAALDFNKWTIRSTLKNVKSLLQKFTHKMSFELQNNLQHYFEMIDEAFSMLVDIYDRIESYSDSVKQADYMAHIVSKPMKSVEVLDSELRNALNNLNILIQSNIMFEQYTIVLNSFKQHYFPFAAHILQEFELPERMQLNDSETLRSDIIKKIETMKVYITKDESTLNEYSKLVHRETIFDRHTIGSSPFYVWKYDAYGKDIQQLLNGSEILIKADIAKGLNFNAVKFNEIGVNFKLKNESLQENLNSVLRNFEISMTLVGNNYYRCGERYYYISFDDNITMSYIIDRDQVTGKRINPNLVYSTIRDGHFFRSPYGLWNVKLRNVNDFITFEHLKTFSLEPIDLELVGRGYYIEQDPYFNFNICMESLDKLYSVENVAKELNG